MLLKNLARKGQKWSCSLTISFIVAKLFLPSACNLVLIDSGIINFDSDFVKSALFLEFDKNLMYLVHNVINDDRYVATRAIRWSTNYN